MTTNIAAAYPTELDEPRPDDRSLRTAGAEPIARTLVAEHALLLQGVHRRVWPVLALIGAGTRPTAEVETLVAFLRTSLFRQASDEEALLFRGDAGTPFARLTAEHARLYSLTERLAQANVTRCPLPELRRMVVEVTNLLARHFATEQALLTRLVEERKPVPGAAEVASGAQTWLPADDAPLLIVLDDLPREHAAQLTIQRLLRLAPGQRAEIRSSDRCGLERLYTWFRGFDSSSYGVEYGSADDSGDLRLHVCRRRDR